MKYKFAKWFFDWLVSDTLIKEILRSMVREELDKRGKPPNYAEIRSTIKWIIENELGQNDTFRTVKDETFISNIVQRINELQLKPRRGDE